MPEAAVRTVRTGTVDRCGARDACGIVQGKSCRPMQTSSVRVLYIGDAHNLINVIHLGGYEPSTPYQTSKKRKTSASRPTAGPSTTKAHTTRQRKPSIEPPMVVEDYEEDVAEIVESKSKRRCKGALTVLVTNGKAKGKGRASSTVNGHKNDADLVIIDESDDEVLSVAKPPPSIKKGKTHAGSSLLVEEGEIVEGKVEGTRSASFPELERMREERDLVRPLPAPKYKTTTEHCFTV